MNRIDLTPLYRSSVGFDRFESLLDAASQTEKKSAGYPPYNIEALEDDNYAITVAVAGFTQDELMTRPINCTCSWLMPHGQERAARADGGAAAPGLWLWHTLGDEGLSHEPSIDQRRNQLLFTHSCFQQKNIMLNYNLYPRMLLSIIKK